MKTKVLWVISLILFLTSVVIVFGFRDKGGADSKGYEDGIRRIDPDTIILGDSGAHVSFSDVILSRPEETRKLVVMEQEATVSASIEKSKIKNLDFNVLKQNQDVTYTAKGSFVVDLDELDAKNVIDDTDNKKLTIKIKHPHLDTIEIDPHKIKIGEQENGILAFGDLTLSVNDYVSIEKELQSKLKTKFDTSANGQEADDIALQMVKEIYEPVVKAVDKDYLLVVEFQQ